MKVTIEKNTDQLNYEDFLGGVTMIVTIADVKKGSKEQQYDIAIEGDKRVWRPPVTVLKQLVDAWGDTAADWVGHRAALYGDPDVMFAGEKVGGIRVSHVSHIAAPKSSRLTTTRGRRGSFTLQPLPDAPPIPTEPTAEQIAACVDLAELKAMWEQSGPDRRAQIEARAAEIKASQEAQG